MSDLDHIHKRPGMYIGTIGNGSHESDVIYNPVRSCYQWSNLRTHDELKELLRERKEKTQYILYA